MKMFMKGLVIAALATLAPLPAQAEMTELNFGSYQPKASRILSRTGSHSSTQWPRKRA